MAKAQVNEHADDKDSFVDELKPGTKLMHGQYTIESFLNAGGFGITYLAKDSLDRKIVIKECFPGAFCRRSRYIVQARSRAHQNELKSIVRLFVQEARSLAKLNHPNIVGVHQVFEDNDTAYMALDFVEGRDLLDTIEDPNHTLTPPQIKVILKEVLGAVGFIHDQGILHRDISPDNILINQDLHPVLIDFGAAREEATKQSRVLSALRVVKDGYSPQEFYIAGSEQSPSSDLYALGASFYHLINKEVPPNSQARLAAIASGDPDPYEKLAGRFPEYSNEFLDAIDKALAVLPKDRLQSATDWLDMMDGKKGNVTPLNVTSAATKGAKSEASDATPKSKMPLLLGSAAVIAILGGVGVMMMSGGEDAPVAPPVEVAQEPVTPVTETPTAPAEVVEATPEPEPETAPVIVEGPVIVDTPALRPTARPENIEVAAVPEPLPEPAETPRLTTTEPAANAEFPDQTGNRPVADTQTADVALPATPDTVEEIGTGLAVDIDAVVPGNELTQSTVDAIWRVELPFSANDPTSNVITEVGLISPIWVKPGLQITAVNGAPVTSIADISDALRETTDISEATPTVTAVFDTLDPETGEAAQYNWGLPVLQEIALDSGVKFTSSFAGDKWRTAVTEMPSNLAGGLQVGDVVVSYIPTAESVTERDSLLNIFNRELDNNVEQFMFAVQRDGSMWVASLIYSASQN